MEENESDEYCIEGYNEELLDPIIAWSSYTLKTIVLLSVILCLFSMKYQHLAKFFYYIELCIRVCALLVPNATNEQHTAVFLTMLSLTVFVAFYCD